MTVYKFTSGGELTHAIIKIESFISELSDKPDDIEKHLATFKKERIYENKDYSIYDWRDYLSNLGYCVELIEVDYTIVFR